AASVRVSTTALIQGCASNAAEIVGLMSRPPTTVPTMIEITVSPSIQLLPLTRSSGGSISVTMPYLAGEYAAAPTPTNVYAMNTVASCESVERPRLWQRNISAQPAILMAFVTNMTCPLGSVSAKAPTNAASTT